MSTISCQKELFICVHRIERNKTVISLLQAWSITFHSWLTFVLLLLACIIWMFPNSRHVCYLLSEGLNRTVISLLQAWSITFHSWLTFVLLLLACIIWMFPNSRHVCYLLSPFILLYAVCLLLIQFVFGMNLKELPTEVNGIKLADIGLKTFTYPCLQLALQVSLVMMLIGHSAKTFSKNIIGLPSALGS